MKTKSKPVKKQAKKTVKAKTVKARVVKAAVKPEVGPDQNAIKKFVKAQVEEVSVNLDALDGARVRKDITRTDDRAVSSYKSIDFEQVGTLLALARKAHLAAQVVAKGGPRPQGFKASWQEAYEVRRKAHGLDPMHSAEAWKAEQWLTSRGQDTHETMMRFYAFQGCV